MTSVLTGFEKLARALFPQTGNDVGEHQLSVHQATLLSGEDQVAHRLLVQQRCIPKNITTNATTIVAPYGAYLKGITVNQPGSADWQAILYDGFGLSTDPIIGTLKNFAGPYIEYSDQVAYGLTVVTSGTVPGDITVHWSR